MARELKPCGTFAAYARHLRKKEEPCDACKQAARDQKNVRADATRSESAAVVSLAIAAAPPAPPAAEEISELDDALENLRIVKAVMDEAPANAIGGLSKRREELVARIARLQTANKPKVSALDQLAQRRADRLAAAAN
jgi:hypothetical protein